MSGLGAENSGIVMSGGVISSVAGDISIEGNGGGGSGSNHYGVWMAGGAIVTSLATANVRITGTAGAVPGGHTNIGVHLDNGSVTSSDGRLELNGTGGPAPATTISES